MPNKEIRSHLSAISRKDALLAALKSLQKTSSGEYANPARLFCLIILIFLKKPVIYFDINEIFDT